MLGGAIKVCCTAVTRRLQKQAVVGGRHARRKGWQRQHAGRGRVHAKGTWAAGPTTTTAALPAPPSHQAGLLTVLRTPRRREAKQRCIA